MPLFNFNCLVSPWITFFTCVGGSPDCERCTAGSLRWFWEGQMRSTSFAPDHGRECHLSLNFGVLKVKSCESWKIREYTTFFFWVLSYCWDIFAERGDCNGWTRMLFIGMLFIAGGPTSTSRSELRAGLLCFTGPPFPVKKALAWCCDWKIVVCLWLVIFLKVALGVVKPLLIQWLSINWYSSLRIMATICECITATLEGFQGISTFYIDLCRVSSISFLKVTCLSDRREYRIHCFHTFSFNSSFP